MKNPGVYLLKNNNTLRVLINLETSYNPLEKSIGMMKSHLVLNRTIKTLLV